MTHLKFADENLDLQAAMIFSMCREFGPLYDYFARLREMDLPDAWIVSGAIYNNVWNVLTDRPAMHGVKDVDIFYFDADAITYDDEDKIIGHAEAMFAGLPVPVEVRNQARVHLWYPAHFGFDYPKLSDSLDAIDRFACTTHSVGMRLNHEDQFELYAPFGLTDIFSFKLMPNYGLPNKKTHLDKGERLCSLWPELRLVPWLDEVPAALVQQPNQTLRIIEPR